MRYRRFVSLAHRAAAASAAALWVLVEPQQAAVGLLELPRLHALMTPRLAVSASLEV